MSAWAVLAVKQAAARPASEPGWCRPWDQHWTSCHRSAVIRRLRHRDHARGTAARQPRRAGVARDRTVRGADDAVMPSADWRSYSGGAESSRGAVGRSGPRLARLIRRRGTAPQDGRAGLARGRRVRNRHEPAPARGRQPHPAAAAGARRSAPKHAAPPASWQPSGPVRRPAGAGQSGSCRPQPSGQPPRRIVTASGRVADHYPARRPGAGRLPDVRYHCRVRQTRGSGTGWSRRAAGAHCAGGQVGDRRQRLRRRRRVARRGRGRPRPRASGRTAATGREPAAAPGLPDDQPPQRRLAAAVGIKATGTVPSCHTRRDQSESAAPRPARCRAANRAPGTSTPPSTYCARRGRMVQSLEGIHSAGCREHAAPPRVNVLGEGTGSSCDRAACPAEPCRSRKARAPSVSAEQACLR